mmetsp:Transcript_101273/g.325479  ORF Transcript_101273/g.325479 Transcript_101273/m.325479 type:complete len:95 (-) Transcript_101273:2-286(-)
MTIKVQNFANAQSQAPDKATIKYAWRMPKGNWKTENIFLPEATMSPLSAAALQQRCLAAEVHTRGERLAKNVPWRGPSAAAPQREGGLFEPFVP